ncbi:MAG TPA: VOC family protein [Chloroflexia bacterium]|nr:VOC family protein [Chloroflexia bacterium]
MIEEVVKVGFTVSDLEQLVPFYTDVLGFERLSSPPGSGGLLPGN